MNDNLIHVITTFIKSKSDLRNEELLFVLNKNLEHEYIGSVTVYTENDETCVFLSNISNPKLKVVRNQNRFTYAEAISLVNLQPGNTFAITNADIFFDDSLWKLDLTDIEYVYCLTKCEYHVSSNSWYHVQLNHCFDAYIFRSPLPINTGLINFYFGVPGCDSRLAYEASKIRKVLNPSRIIRALHVHASRYRTYTEGDRVGGAYVSIDLADDIVYHPSFVHPYSG